RPAASATSTPVPRAAPPEQPIMSWQPPVPIVGRQAELAAMERHLGNAARGQGRLVIVQGEAGIGKTRIVEELFWRIEHGMTEPSVPRPAILAGHCYEA